MSSDQVMGGMSGLLSVGEAAANVKALCSRGRKIGRFVFHCHILKPEERGLMAPIKVWEPPTGTVLQ
jgi:FtsP/CotA-like multicopper oxidase with cupredoxin domain